MHAKPAWETDFEIHEERYFGLCGGGVGGGSGVFWRMFLGTKVLAPKLGQGTH